MSTTIESGGGLSNKVGFIAVCAAMVILFATLSQPAWRGEEMVAETKSDCTKRRGVMLEHKKMFGTSYECASRLDR
jgi:hypothetical protein